MKNISIALLIIASLTSCKKDKSNSDADLANLNSNLVVYYPLDGNATDAGANRINGALMSISGNYPTATEDHLGNANKALLFNGTN